MNKKSILIVTRSLLAGGAERVIAQLANYFDEKAIDVSIVTINSSDVFYELRSNIKLYKIGKRSDNKLHDRYLRYKELRNLVKEIKPNTVLTMPEEIGVYVILALLGTRFPVYVSERNNPWVMPDVKATRILRKLMYPFAKGIIFQTEMAQSFFPKRIQNKGIVLDNPIDLDRIPLMYYGERQKIVSAVGRLEPQKNFNLLIEAFARFYKNHPDYKLVIYGEGSLKRKLEEKISELDMEGIISLPGSKIDVLDKIRMSSMFILSSDYEGMPNVLLEAMCMGMPVIATDCPSGGPHKLIDNGKNGLLVPVGDCDKLLKGMEILCNEETANNLANNAYTLRDRFSNQDIFYQWEKFLLS